MMHRQADIRLRGDQENRSNAPAFPKTPKNNIAAPSTHFITPANKPRIALGAKSTNVHHRQPFSSAVKTGKRHSPVSKVSMTLGKPVFKLDVPLQEEAPTQTANGGAALREALDRALATGIDIPEPEYAPPPVTDELPYSEPENMEPMDWDAFDVLSKQAKKSQRWKAYTQPMQEEPLPAFVPIEEDGSDKVQSKATSKVASYAAPTASARARTKGASGKENASVARPSGKIPGRSTPSALPGPNKALSIKPINLPSSARRPKSNGMVGPPKSQFHKPADAALFDFDIDSIL